MSKLELLKKLECLIAFQSICINEAKWDDFDKAEDKIKDLEINIMKESERRE